MHASSNRILRCPKCDRTIESRQFINTLEFGVPFRKCGNCGHTAYDGTILEAALLSDKSLLKDAARKSRDYLIIADFFIGIAVSCGIAAITNNPGAAIAAAVCAITICSVLFTKLMKKRRLKSYQKEIRVSMDRLSSDEKYARTVISMQGVQADSAFERMHKGSASVPAPGRILPRDPYARKADRKDQRRASRLLRVLTKGRSTAIKVFLVFYVLATASIPPVMGSVLKIPVSDQFSLMFYLLFICFAAATVGFIVLASRYVRRYIPLRQCIVHLIDVGVGNCINELTGPNPERKEVDGAVFSDMLFYCRRAGIVARYEDILWFYEAASENRIYGIPIQKNDCMFICTVLGKAHFTTYSQAVFDELKRRNRNMMVGYTMLNQQTYDALLQKRKEIIG